MNTVELIGSKAPYSLPLGLFLGLLIPDLAHFLSSYLIHALFLSLTIALICVPTERLIESFSRYKLLVTAVLWILVASPILVYWLISLATISESVALAAIIAAAAPPATSTAAIVIFLRLNSAVAVCVTILSLLIFPIALPIVLNHFISINLNLNVWNLSFQLVTFIFISLAIAILIKTSLGEQRIAKNKLALDGISAIAISAFTIGIMNGVSDIAIARPWFVVENLIVSSLLVLGLYIFTTLIFWRAGATSAFALAVVSGNGNLGLIYLVLVDKVNTEVLMFFSIGQIPMYLLPTLLSSIVKRMRKEQPCD